MGGGHVFSLIQEGGFEKLLCDFMGGCEKNVDLTKNHLPPPLPAVYLMNADLDATTLFTAKKTAIHSSPRNAGCHTTSKIQTHSSGGSSFQRGTRFVSRFAGSAGARRQ